MATDRLIQSLVMESTSTEGPGTLDLDGAATGWNRFRIFFDDGDTVIYVRRNANGSKHQLIKGLISYDTGAGGRDQLTVVTVLKSTDGGASPTAIDWGADDNPCAVFCASAEDLLDSAVRSHYGAARPSWLKKGLWVAAGAGATARKLNWFDGTDDIEITTINETANAVEYADPATPLAAANKQYVDKIGSPGARLTGTSATPVTAADVTAQATIYVTPYAHNLTKLWDGTRDVLYVRDELAFVLSATYHLSGENFDVYEYLRAGAVVLGTSPKWTNDTTLADARARRNGRMVNNASITLRFGTGAGDTEAVAANRANYLGTIRCSANGQTEDSLVKRFVWNAYNRVPRAMQVLEATNSWTYSTASFRQANNSTANQLALVRGLDEDAVFATALSRSTNSDANPYGVATSIGLDSTTTISGVTGTAHPTSSSIGSSVAAYSGFPGLGYHYLAWLEYGAGAATQTWYGDNGTPTVVQTGMTGMVMA